MLSDPNLYAKEHKRKRLKQLRKKYNKPYASLGWTHPQYQFVLNASATNTSSNILIYGGATNVK